MERQKVRDFLYTVESYYVAHGRHDLPWRAAEPDGTFDPYKVLISELMLQQTQVPRVIPKYEAFLRRFPTIHLLAEAQLGDVLVAWQGLGYNRRAKFLWLSAQKIVGEFGGGVPRDQQALESLPGVGANTAGAILAYAFNKPAIFIETNIRTVYIHHFFEDEANVSDAAIRAAVTKTLDRQNPRVFYWSLMDYGSYLKQTVGNMSQASKAYVKQSKFAGSVRQIRGQVLRVLAAGALTEAALLDELRDDRAAVILAGLASEGLIRKVNDRYRLP